MYAEFVILPHILFLQYTLFFFLFYNIQYNTFLHVEDL